MKKISIPITVLLLSTHMSAQEAKQQTKNDSIKKIEEIISKNFNLSPRGIRELLKLNKPIYKKTAAYGHFGRQSEDDGSFSWEKTDLIKYFQSKV